MSQSAANGRTSQRSPFLQTNKEVHVAIGRERPHFATGLALIIFWTIAESQPAANGRTSQPRWKRQNEGAIQRLVRKRVAKAAVEAEQPFNQGTLRQPWLPFGGNHRRL